jgi:hypothetical protein
MTRALWVVLVTACSVPGLDLTGKTCPCGDGYMCVANHCMRGSGGGSDAASPFCLGSAPGAMLYGDNFDSGSLDSGWMPNGGSWNVSNGQLVQTDAGAALAYALTTHVSQADYRVTAQMSGQSGGTALGIAVRGALGAKTQYDCLWEPGVTGVLLLQSTNNGGQATTLASQVGLPSAGASETVTMEMLASGTELRCCLDNIAGATVSSSNPTPSYTSGQPGLATSHMAASFDNFAVYAN